MSTATPIDRFVREYEEYHRIDEGRRSERQRELRQLADHAEKDLLDIGASDVKSYLAAESDRGLNVNTIRKNLNLIKPFYHWAWESDLIDAERLMAIGSVKPPRGSNGNGLPKPYSRAELDQFRDELAFRWPRVEQRWWDRWRRGTSRFRRVQPECMRIQIEAIVALALHCGLRRHEIFALAVDDFHYDNAYVVVRHGKGDKFREVPHTDASREAVRAWLELRSELLAWQSGLNPDDSPWLCLAWETIATQPMRWDRFRKLLLTIPNGEWRFHRFRHTCGTEWLRATKRLEIVKELLGHSRIQQTLGYAELVRDDLHEAVDKSQREFAEAVGA